MADAFARQTDLLLAWRGGVVGALSAALALFLVVERPGELEDLGAGWFDAMKQIAPRDRLEEPVIIVSIDEESVAQIGAWPWPREETAKLFQRIAAAGPAAVGVDMLFVEPEIGAPAELARHPDAPPEARAWLESLRSGDDALAEAIQAGPFVLAVGSAR